MRDWSAESWVTFFGAVGLFVGALATAAVKIIQALREVKGEILHSRALSDERAETVKETIRGTGSGDGGPK